MITHAFFKATLFLGAGTVIHGNDDNQDMRIMGGFRKYMPYTAIAFIIAFLAIAGVPPFAGFWAKDGVLEKVFQESDYGLWVIGLLAAILTGAYMTRQVYLTFFGNERFHAAADAGAAGDEHAEVPAPATPTVAYGEAPRTPVMHHDPHEGNGLMVGPVVLLAVLAVIGGVLDLPFERIEYLDQWLDPAFADAHHVIEAPSFLGGVALSLLAFGMALLGLGLAWALYRRGLESVDRDPFDERLGFFGRLFGHAYYYDEGISRAVDGPLRASPAGCRGCSTPRSSTARNGVGLVVREPASVPQAPDRSGAQLHAGDRAGHRRPAHVPPDLGGPLMSFPILSAIIVTPAVGALIIALIPARRVEAARAVGYTTTAATLGFTLWMLWQFQTGRAGYQFVESERWMGSIGVKYVVGVDGISLFMIVLTALLFPIGLLASAKLTVRVKAFTAWMLLLESALLGVFLSLDLIVFFVFFEIVLVPMYFIILGWGHDRRNYAALKFFLYTMAGSAFLLVGLLARVPPPVGHRPPHLRSAHAHRVGAGWARRRHGEVVVPGVLRRVRGQGAVVPAAHLAPGPRTPRHRRPAR